MIEEDKFIKDTFQDFFSWWKTETKPFNEDNVNIEPINISAPMDNPALFKTEVTDIVKQPVSIMADYVFITDLNTLEVECKKRLGADTIGIDVETTGYDPSVKGSKTDPFIDKIRIIQIAVKELPVMIVDLFAIKDHSPVKELLTGASLKIFQNAKFDLKMLQTGGIKVEGNIFDTMLASQLLGGGLRAVDGGHSLEELVKRYLQIEMSKEEQKSDWSVELSQKQLQYACLDAHVLLQLQEILNGLLVKNGLEAIARLEFDCLQSVVDMELNGFFLALEKQESIKELLKSEVDQAELEVRVELGDINLRSHKQLLPVLQKKTGIRLKSTSKEYLMAIGHPLFSKLINYREKSKFLKDNFLRLPENIHPVTGRIHAQYFQIGAATGRFTCKEPPLQTIPRNKQIRDCFRAEVVNKLVIADYSQIELRIAAEISKDPVMIEAYSKGQDLHTLTASIITGKPAEEVTKNDRQLAKAVNFGLIYGAGAETLRDYAKSNYDIDLTLKDAEHFRRKFFKLYRGLMRWHDKVNFRKKYVTYTIGKRYRKFNKRGKFKLTDRLNSPVQGTGADILKKAMVLLRPRIKGMAKIVHIVHDEIILEAPEPRAEEVKKILEDTMKEAGQYYIKLVPVEVECHICDSWAEK